MVVTQADKLKEYNKVGITTSNQESLILICYNGIINCLRIAKESIPDRKKWPEVNNNMIKAQQGLALLADAINTKEGGEIGKNLLSLYDFLIRYLIKANMKKDISMIDEAITMLVDLKESWEKAFEKLHLEMSDSTVSALRQSPRNVVNIVG
jgi:flagellar protein FliS